MTMYSARMFILSTAFAVSAVATASSAGAASAFDGAWKVVIGTSSGECTPPITVEGRITNGIIYYGDTESTYVGRVAPSGAVNGSFSAAGKIRVAGSGQLSRDSGSGTWHGQGPKGPCSGTWTAKRS